MRDVRVILIGGTSHVGKTTLAKALASRLGWHRRSTDGMARHPGRPWGLVKDHVNTHYRSLSVDELTTALCRHYERLWPTVEHVVESHARARVHTVSGFDRKSADEKLLVEKFLGRTTRYNDLLLDGVRRLGLSCIDIGSGRSVDELVEQIVTAVRPGRADL